MSGDGNGPTAEDKARYDALKKELLQALPSKRAIDKQLVRAIRPGCKHTNLYFDNP
jgi:hypothetical protein